jgi:quinol-cytochrome oxidoreductase complex cytochrome b subunit
LIVVVHQIPLGKGTAVEHLFFLSAMFTSFAYTLVSPFLLKRIANRVRTKWERSAFGVALVSFVSLVIFEVVRLTPFRPDQPLTMTIFGAMIFLFGLLSIFTTTKAEGRG